MLANYLPKTAEQLHLEHQKRRAAIWTRYPKIKATYDARIAWRQSPAGIEFCASRVAKLLAVESGKGVSEMLPVARQRIRARFANLKTSSPDRPPATKPSQLKVHPAAAPFSPGIAPTATAAPRTAARPAVVAPKPAAPTDREYSETLRLWTDKMRGRYVGGSRFKAAMDSMIATVKRDGRNAAFAKMKAELSAK